MTFRNNSALLWQMNMFNFIALKKIAKICQDEIGRLFDTQIVWHD